MGCNSSSIEEITPPASITGTNLKQQIPVKHCTCKGCNVLFPAPNTHIDVKINYNGNNNNVYPTQIYYCNNCNNCNKFNDPPVFVVDTTSFRSKARADMPKRDCKQCAREFLDGSMVDAKIFINGKLYPTQIPGCVSCGICHDPAIKKILMYIIKQSSGEFEIEFGIYFE